MTELDQIVGTVKRLLKGRGLTYRDVARSLKISEPSVKRLFASGRFTVERLAQICRLLGYTVAELTAEAMASMPKLSSLTPAQEAEVVADPKLLLVAVCAINHWTLDDIVVTYQLSTAECVKRLLRLDRLGLIELLPGNRIRLMVARDFEWLPEGPIARFFRTEGQGDFLDSRFHEANASMAFVHGMLTEAAVAQLQTELRRLRAAFSQLHEESLAVPFDRKQGIGLMLAMRRWEPAGFLKLRRKT